MENEAHTSPFIPQMAPVTDDREGHGCVVNYSPPFCLITKTNCRSWFSRSTHVALTNPTIFNVLGSYYENSGHGPNQNGAIAPQETSNHQHENSNLREHSAYHALRLRC